MLNKKAILNTLAALTIGISTLTFTTPALADVNMYDNFFTVGNNTAPKGDPAKSVDAAPQNVVEFFIRVRNTGSEDAKDVQVWATLPSGPNLHLVTTANIRPNNRDRVNVQISDQTTVNVTGGQPVQLAFLPGHTRFAGVTNKFNCPNVCDINDQDIINGIDVGDVPAGQEVQVAFKAFLTNVPNPSATVAPTTAPTQAPTAAPTASAPANNVQCPAGTTFSRIEGNNIICINNVNNNNNTNNNNQTITITIPTGSPTVLAAATTNVKELPNTGLPLAGLALAGLTPVGVKLRKSGKLANLSPNFVWEKRELDKQV
jgi:uncharacterized repeat protein (TIGR01451 family)